MNDYDSSLYAEYDRQASAIPECEGCGTATEDLVDGLCKQCFDEKVADDPCSVCKRDGCDDCEHYQNRESDDETEQKTGIN